MQRETHIQEKIRLARRQFEECSSLFVALGDVTR